MDSDDVMELLLLGSGSEDDVLGVPEYPTQDEVFSDPDPSDEDEAPCCDCVLCWVCMHVCVSVFFFNLFFSFCLSVVCTVHQ